MPLFPSHTWTSAWPKQDRPPCSKPHTLALYPSLQALHSLAPPARECALSLLWWMIKRAATQPLGFCASASSWEAVTPLLHVPVSLGTLIKHHSTHPTSQPTVPFPKQSPQSPGHSIKFLLIHLSFLPLKCKFHETKHPAHRRSSPFLFSWVNNNLYRWQHWYLLSALYMAQLF